jgi:nucleoside 2-deoxyribosyltransferase
MQIYLASPLGFSSEFNSYRQRVRVKLISQGHTVIDPWERDYAAQFTEARKIDGYLHRIDFYQQIARKIGQDNRFDIRRSKAVLGVLDGPEPDSGTVGEICYASGAGKLAFGLRTDFRDMGDMPGVPLNLQVLDFIEASGGKLFRDVEEIFIPELP